MRPNQFGSRENVEVEGKRRTGELEALCDFSGRESVGSILNEQAKDIEARFLGQGR